MFTHSQLMISISRKRVLCIVNLIRECKGQFESSPASQVGNSLQERMEPEKGCFSTVVAPYFTQLYPHSQDKQTTIISLCVMGMCYMLM